MARYLDQTNQQSVVQRDSGMQLPNEGPKRAENASGTSRKDEFAQLSREKPVSRGMKESGRSITFADLEEDENGDDIDYNEQKNAKIKSLSKEITKSQVQASAHSVQATESLTSPGGKSTKSIDILKGLTSPLGEKKFGISSCF